MNLSALILPLLLAVVAALVALGLVVVRHRLLLPCLVFALPCALGWPAVVAAVACGAVVAAPSRDRIFPEVSPGKRKGRP